MRRIAINLVVLLAAVSCGDDSSSERSDVANATTISTTTEVPASTSTTTEEADAPSTTSTETPASTAPIPTEQPFEIERAVGYIAQTLDNQPEGYPPEGYFHWGMMRTESLTVTPEDDPRVVLMQTMQRGWWPPEGPRVEMVLAGHNPGVGGGFLPLEVTDGVVLTTNDPNVWLLIQCFQPDGAAVGNVAVYWEPQDGVRTVVQAWEYDVDLAKLVDIEPDSFRRHGECETPTR